MASNIQNEISRETIPLNFTYPAYLVSWGQTWRTSSWLDCSQSCSPGRSARTPVPGTCRSTTVWVNAGYRHLFYGCFRIFLRFRKCTYPQNSSISASILLLYSTPHKVLTYVRRVQSSVWRLPKYLPPPPFHPARGGGVHTRRAVRGWGSIFFKTPDTGLASQYNLSTVPPN